MVSGDGWLWVVVVLGDGWVVAVDGAWCWVVVMWWRWWEMVGVVCGEW